MAGIIPAHSVGISLCDFRAELRLSLGKEAVNRAQREKCLSLDNLGIYTGCP